MRSQSLPSTATRAPRLALETLEHRVLLSADGLPTGFPPSMEVDDSPVHETVQGDLSVSTGDANRDGLFDQRDLAQLSVAGKYLTAESANWSEGDWNGDSVFDQRDLVVALRSGTYSPVTSAAHSPAAKVEGSGIVTLEATAQDEEFGILSEGDRFAGNRFEIQGEVLADGSASGTAIFVFGEAFSTPWGAEVITLKGEIDTATVREDGTVVLEGVSFEEDFVGGVVTFEEYSPFEIVVDAERSFTLRWCKLPTLDLEITSGHLVYFAAQADVLLEMFQPDVEPGDFNADGKLDAADIDALTAAAILGSNAARFDLNADHVVNQQDRDIWIEQIMLTWPGDASLDGQFDQRDVVLILQGREYEDGVVGNSGWSDGDWNGDGEFDRDDLVAALQGGGYVNGPRAFPLDTTPSAGTP